MLLYVTLLFLSVSPTTPCQDDPLYTTRCSSWRSHCSSGRWGPWMSVFCPSTCGVCRECQCEDSPAYKDRCGGWKRHCASTNTHTRTFVQERCPSTCNQCTCCSERQDKHTYCDKWRLAGYCEEGPYVAWMFNNCHHSCTCGRSTVFSVCVFHCVFSSLEHLYLSLIMITIVLINCQHILLGIPI